MEYWTPKSNNNFGGYASSPNALSSLQVPDVQLPEVGAKILLLALPYGIQVVQEGMQIPNGADAIEVEVVSLKKAKVSLE